MIKPKLYIFSGLPGAGKSTLAKKISTKLGAVYLRIDTFEQGIRDFCEIKDVGAQGYRLSYLVAKENLSIGNSVVADSVNPIALSRQEWQNVAESIGIEFVNIEDQCSDPVEHKRRVETRKPEIENHKLPTWEEVIACGYESWEDPRIEIDTASKSISASVEDLLLLLKN